jgi:uncharacterized protein with GYD domain
MAKYLVQASFTSTGAKGLQNEGGTSRKQTLEKLIADMGGTLEAFYFGFGSHDVYVLADLPDNATAAALSLAVNASGAVQLSTVVLMTPAEIDEATKKTVAYRPPGG